MHGGIAISMQPKKINFVFHHPLGLVHLASYIMAEVPSKSPSNFSLLSFYFIHIHKLLIFNFYICIIENMILFWLISNFNYGAAGKAIGVDLLNNPDLVATNPTISFKTALWFWMTSQGDKPSCHDVMTGKWVPSNEDVSAKRLPGYGLTINIINGNNECGKGADARAADRLGFYQRYCDVLNIQYGDNFNCVNQKPFT